MKLGKKHIKSLILVVSLFLLVLGAYIAWGNPLLNQLNKAIEMHSQLDSFNLDEKLNVLQSNDGNAGFSRTRHYAFLKDEMLGRFSYSQKLPSKQDAEYIMINNASGSVGVLTAEGWETVYAQNPTALELFTEKLSPVAGFAVSKATQGDVDIYTWRAKVGLAYAQIENIYNYYVSPNGYIEKIILISNPTNTVERENAKAVRSITTYEITNVNNVVGYYN